MYTLPKDLLDSINSMNAMFQQLQNQSVFSQIEGVMSLHRQALDGLKPNFDIINSIEIPSEEILDSLNVCNQFLEEFRNLDFSPLVSSQISDYIKTIEILRQPVIDFTNISNQLNFDYLKFYTISYDFDKGRFFDSENEEVDQKYIEIIKEFEKVRDSKFTTIQTYQPDILVHFKQDWYSILDKLKQSIENWYHKQINKHNFKENDIQTGIASHLDLLEQILNNRSIFFRFEKESVISENGRVDFLFRFINPYREAPVEIKVIEKESYLSYYGTKQLLDYMQRRKYSQGIRLVFNKTNIQYSHFEEDNIIHYFINLHQPASSSLN